MKTSTLLFDCQQKGFTLLEVMIALVIFSIGLIGLAGLQAVSLENNQIAYSRTMASILAYDMADRIRNNPDADYDGVDTSAPPALPSCTGGLANCNSATMVNFDAAEWAAAVTLAQNNLLNSRGVINRNGNIYTIYIGWNENKVTGAPGAITDCSSFTVVNYECIALVLETYDPTLPTP